MAEIQENNNKEKKGSKQKKMNIRVDFTPMVDMNMLLITFFMLCTSLSKPQTMEISMPSNDKNITEEQQNKVKASQALTLLLAEEGKLYYYEGEPDVFSAIKNIVNKISYLFIFENLFQACIFNKFNNSFWTIKE